MNHYAKSRIFGRFIYADGRIYEGGWLEGKRHGHGVYTWPDGDKFEGEYVDDKKHGHGVYTWANGARYEGNWFKDMRHGQGIYTWLDSATFSGQYVNDKRNGYGEYKFADGSLLKGNRLNELKEGPFTHIDSEGLETTEIYQKDKLVAIKPAKNALKKDKSDDNLFMGMNNLKGSFTLPADDMRGSMVARHVRTSFVGAYTPNLS